MSDKQRFFFIGDEWLYYKITGKASTLEGILLEKIEPLVRKLIKKRIVSSFFFIRYFNEFDELRIRFKLLEEESLPIVIKEFNKLVKYYLVNRMIVSVIAETYNRELDRYGEDIIEDIEHIFYYDSLNTLHALKEYNKANNLENRWIIGMNTALFLLNVFTETNTERIEVIEKAFSYHMSSQNLSEKTIHSFDSKYRSMAKEVNNNWGIYNFFSTEADRLALLKILEKIRHLRDRKKLKKDFTTILTSIIHMSFNRIFSTHSNASEMIIYYFLLKKLRSEEAIKRKKILNAAGSN